MGDVKTYKVLYVNRYGSRVTASGIRARSEAEARAKFLNGHPGCEIVEVYEA